QGRGDVRGLRVRGLLGRGGRRSELAGRGSLPPSSGRARAAPRPGGSGTRDAGLPGADVARITPAPPRGTGAAHRPFLPHSPGDVFRQRPGVRGSLGGRRLAEVAATWAKRPSPSRDPFHDSFALLVGS